MPRWTLYAAAAVVAVGLGPGGRDTTAQVPTAPPPREKAAALGFEADLAHWADRAAGSERLLRRAEDLLKRAEDNWREADAQFAQGAITPDQREKARATLRAVLAHAAEARLRAEADRARLLDAQL